MKHKYFATTCDCKTCQSMCHRRPCWPTPREAERMIDAGFAKRMMLDYWSPDERSNGRQVELISPAGCGDEGQQASFMPWGCAFLTEDNRCELHGTNMKPLEGRIADCKDDGSDADETWPPHARMMRLWDCRRGRRVVAKWKKEVWDNE